MNDAALNGMRQYARIICNTGDAPEDWEWRGKWMSQHMINITERRAKDMASRYGGIAQKMENEPKLSENRK